VTNLYLIGMMGAGKTYWGQRLAHELRRPFVDLDDYIAQRTGKSPAVWLQESGEASFRQQELAALEEVSRLHHTVVATGGGTPLLPGAARLLKRTGDCLWLDAPPAVLFDRTLSQGVDRPLARDKEAFCRLHRQRRPHYEGLGRRIDTDQPPDKVRDLLLQEREPLASGSPAPQLLAPAATGDYPVQQLNTVEAAGEWLGEKMTPPFMIVAPPLVYTLYGQRLKEVLGDDDIHHCLIPDGEQYKTLETVKQLYESFLDAALHRSATIIALGGGVCGDMTGFAAATFLRGIPLVQLPTTLLAMVDSSVGGKVAVNLPAGKNLVGTFYPPRAALLVIPTLHSLPDDVYRQGLAEIVKCALLSGDDQLRWLESHASALARRDSQILPGAIYAANRLKASVVREDEYDHGGRHVLNLGHTLAHALEKTLDYRGIGHGDAVAYGLQWALALSPARPLLPRIRRLLAALGFGIRLPASLDAGVVLSQLKHDKKRSAEGVKLVLLEEVGVPRLVTGCTHRAMRQAFEGLKEPVEES